MKKSLKIILIVLGLIIVLLITSFIGYKMYIINNYRVDYETNNEYDKIVGGLKISNTFTIKNEVLNEDEYIEFNDIKVKDYFKDFQKQEYDGVEDTYVKYTLYDSDNTPYAAFWIGTIPTYTELIKSDPNVFSDSSGKEIITNLSDFIDKQNINNDLELFDYLVKQKDIKYNIFSSSKEIKENYSLVFMSNIMLPSIETTTLINGDYTGYMFNLENDIKEVTILIDDTRYIFTFINEEYFTDDFIKEILNTVIISD